jgi:hypothetical protein
VNGPTDRAAFAGGDHETTALPSLALACTAVGGVGMEQQGFHGPALQTVELP